jgi:hypothetical protein
VDARPFKGSLSASVIRTLVAGAASGAISSSCAPPSPASRQARLLGALRLTRPRGGLDVSSLGICLIEVLDERARRRQDQRVTRGWRSWPLAGSSDDAGAKKLMPGLYQVTATLPITVRAALPAAGAGHDRVLDLRRRDASRWNAARRGQKLLLA